MTKTFLIAVILFGPALNAQEKKDLSFSFSIGPSSSPEYNQTIPQRFISFDMDYYFQKNHIISANYYTGRQYIETFLTTVPLQTAHYKSIALIYKYRFVSTKKISLISGLG